MIGSQHRLEQFGFSFKKGGTHTRRTMMLKELAALFEYVDNPDSDREDYRKAIETDNCLGKRSFKNRQFSYHYLVELYALDPGVPLFRALRYFWQRDESGRSLLALLCAYARDPVLRSAAAFILDHQEGATVSREALEEYIDNMEPGRFSPVTLRSVAQNINSTFTQSGHLVGRVRKIRTKANSTPGSAAMAAYMAHLSGGRGDQILSSDYSALLDVSKILMIEQIEDASRRGWMVFKRISDVIEVTFPNLMDKPEA